MRMWIDPSGQGRNQCRAVVNRAMNLQIQHYFENFLCVCVCVCVCVYVYIYIYMCVYIYIYIYEQLFFQLLQGVCRM